MKPELPEKSYGYIQTRATGNHLTRVQIDGHRVRVTAIGWAGGEDDYTITVLESFTIQ